MPHGDMVCIGTTNSWVAILTAPLKKKHPSSYFEGTKTCQDSLN
jgi:hypothetical protein